MADQRKYELWGLHLSGEYLWRQTDYLQIVHSPLEVEELRWVIATPQL